jgi:subtilisin family serine protease
VPESYTHAAAHGRGRQNNAVHVGENCRAAIDLVRLRPLMDRTTGSPEVRIGLIDGPVDLDHPHLQSARVRAVSPALNIACGDTVTEACTHGTLVAGVLVGERSSGAPAICPGCTLLVRPIFLEKRSVHRNSTAASVEEVAAAIVEAIDAGARILNLSAALIEPSTRAERRMHEALDYAAQRGAIVVAAAGNQATLGSSAITRHPWVIPVIASDLSGKPTLESNLSHSAGKRGVAAPGEGIKSLAPNASIRDFAGTSAAVPFVAGAIALLWSLLPGATAGQLRHAVSRCGGKQRSSVVPPLLDGADAYQLLSWQQQRSAS